MKVYFYEKPGCRTNRRQRERLVQLGHEVVVRDLLREAWSASRLRAFFGRLPVSAWFNPQAPAIRSGELDPHGLSEDDAILYMLREPLLIRRPLLETEAGCCAGFGRSPLLDHLGLGQAQLEGAEICARDAGRDDLAPGECHEG